MNHEGTPVDRGMNRSKRADGEVWRQRRLAGTVRNLPVVFSAAFPVLCQPTLASASGRKASMRNLRGRKLGLGTGNLPAGSGEPPQAMAPSAQADKLPRTRGAGGVRK